MFRKVTLDKESCFPNKNLEDSGELKLLPDHIHYGNKIPFEMKY